MFRHSCRDIVAEITKELEQELSCMKLEARERKANASDHIVASPKPTSPPKLSASPVLAVSLEPATNQPSPSSTLSERPGSHSDLYHLDLHRPTLAGGDGHV